jgi:hypothetical protein
MHEHTDRNDHTEAAAEIHLVRVALGFALAAVVHSPADLAAVLLSMASTDPRHEGIRGRAFQAHELLDPSARPLACSAVSALAIIDSGKT